MKGLLLLFFTAHTALAEDFHVEVDPNTYSHESFAAKGVKTGDIPERVKRPDAIPDKSEREGTFTEVPGLLTSIAGMDELDRDVLYVRSKTKTISELRSLYPNIPAAQLKGLKKAQSPIRSY